MSMIGTITGGNPLAAIPARGAAQNAVSVPLANTDTTRIDATGIVNVSYSRIKITELDGKGVTSMFGSSAAEGEIVKKQQVVQQARPRPETVVAGAAAEQERQQAGQTQQQDIPTPSFAPKAEVHSFAPPVQQVQQGQAAFSGGTQAVQAYQAVGNVAAAPAFSVSA